MGVPFYKPILTVIFALLLGTGPISGLAGKITTSPVTVKPQFTTDPATRDSRYVMNIMVHDAKEMDALLKRARQLSMTMRKVKNQSRIALVLHGNEIGFFRKSNYDKFKDIVDNAAKLDTDGVIDVKMCKTKMNELGIKESEVPAYVDIVPYGPDEVERLIKKGYIYM